MLGPTLIVLLVAAFFVLLLSVTILFIALATYRDPAAFPPPPDALDGTAESDFARPPG